MPKKASLLLKNSKIAVLSPPALEQADLRISEDLITERGAGLRTLPGEEVVDLSGRIITAGLVCAHTHLYSSLARGMPAPIDAPKNFLEILRKIWWKLDRSLDEESLYYSALVGAVEALRSGTTAIVDHNASPKFIKGSLDVIRQGIEKAGLRGVLCYEVTDRGGKKERDQGLRENERFIKSAKKEPLFRGMVGAHAAFTLSGESLHLVGAVASDCGTGVHIHAAEDKCDITDSQENFRCGLAERLREAGILKKESITAHCVNFDETGLSIIRDSGCWIVHNPRSNMVNRVGCAPLHLFGGGGRSALGTDGFCANMFEEAQIGFYKRQDSRMPGIGMLGLLEGGNRMLGEIFGRKFGRLEKGSVADLVVLDYKPPTPLDGNNLDSHFLFGMNSSCVESVMVGGKWVMKNREIPGLDIEEEFNKAAKAARRLWKKMEEAGDNGE